MMYGLADGLNPVVILYFVMLVFFGAFFLLNIMLGVIKVAFSESYIDKDKVTIKITNNTNFPSTDELRKNQQKQFLF